MYKLIKFKNASGNKFPGHFFPYGRKGIGVDDFIPLLLVLGFFIIVFIFITIGNIFSSFGHTSVVQADFDKIEGNDYLLMYLQAYTGKEDALSVVKGKTNADLIIEAYNTKNYDELKSATIKFFDEIYPLENDECWMISIKTESETISEMVSETCPFQEGLKDRIGQAEIPLSYSAYADVILFKVSEVEPII